MSPQTKEEEEEDYITPTAVYSLPSLVTSSSFNNSVIQIFLMFYI